MSKELTQRSELGNSGVFCWALLETLLVQADKAIMFCQDC